MQLIKSQLNVQTKVYNPDNISYDKYYGVITTTKNVGIIMQKEYDMGDFFLMSPCKITIGNNFFQYHKKTLVALIEKLIMDGHEVHEFDDAKEFFQWISTNVIEE